jgi:hypothetical protein
MTERARTADRPFTCWVHEEAIHCARGHHIARDFLPAPAGGVRCRHVERGASCPEWLFVVSVPAMYGAYTVRATKAQLDEIGRRGLTPVEALEHLGVRWGG